MFKHSVPVPRSYKLASKILKETKENGANPKSILYENKNRHFPVQSIHALIFEAIKHEKQLNDLIVKSKLLTNECRFNPWLARILITELLWGKKCLPGNSKPVATIMQYHKKFENILQTVSAGGSNENDPGKEEAFELRYIRINTLKIDLADAVRHYQDEGWHLVRCTSKSYDEYLKQLENLSGDEFIPDFHVKVVFAFAPNTRFHNDQLYLSTNVFLQDKATALAPFILSPTPGSTVLDMCSAPGMKCTHLAAIMKNEGTIYAVEQNKDRYKVLCEFVESSGATCVKPINGDAATINKTDCPNVDYVLLDPSCSGSGIRRPEKNYLSYDLESGRVQSLASFQAKLLRHALNEFKSAKRVVYSTCSLYCQENEEVIRDVVDNHKGSFRLVSAKEKLNNNWNNVGDPKYKDIGEKCIYALPSKDYTCGFFIAVFENFADEASESYAELQNIVDKMKETENMSDVWKKNAPIMSEDSELMTDFNKRKCKKNKIKNSEHTNNDYIPNNDQIDKTEVDVIIEKKSKKNRHKVIEESYITLLDESQRRISSLLDNDISMIPLKKSDDKEKSSISNLNTGNEIMKKSKKKKIKESVVNQEKIHTARCVEEVDDNVKIKDKKKRKCYMDIVQMEKEINADIIKEESKAEVETNNISKEDVKPKKKKKGIMGEEMNTSPMGANKSYVEYNDSSKKPSKTKKIDQIQEANNVNIESNRDIKIKKAKNDKNAKSSDVDDIVNMVCHQVTKHKKKKKKDSNDEMIDNDNPNIKEKSKNKIEDPNEDLNTVDGNTESKKKRKKKNKGVRLEMDAADNSVKIEKKNKKFKGVTEYNANDHVHEYSESKSKKRKYMDAAVITNDDFGNKKRRKGKNTA